MTNVINTPVNVNSYYFTGPEMKTFPREIEFDGEAVSFASGLRYLVQKGAEAIRLFDMSGADGRVWRLREDHGNWTLLATKGAF